MTACTHCHEHKTVMLVMTDDNPNATDGKGHFWLCGRCWRDAGYGEEREEKRA